MGKPEHRCLRCQGEMVRGAVRTKGKFDARIRVEFVVPGVQTSRNPFAAFKQGLSDEPDDQTIDLKEMPAYLCQTCGHLEFYAWIADEAGELAE